MSRWSRVKKPGGKGRRKKAPPPPPPLISYEDMAQSAEKWDHCKFAPADLPRPSMKRIEWECLKTIHSSSALAWRHKPCSIQIGGGHASNPSFFYLSQVYGLTLLYCAPDHRFDQEISAVRSILPWFRVARFDGRSILFDKVPSYRPKVPKRSTGDMRDSMSSYELEHSEKLDDWTCRGWIHGWLYEPVSWSLGWRMRYTPDFLVYGPEGISWHEIKGQMPRPDAEIKLKTFSALYPFFKVELYQKAREKGEKHPSWKTRVIQPGDGFGFSLPAS